MCIHFLVHQFVLRFVIFSLEYTAPESLPSPTGQLGQVDSKADMWSLGMILHMLLFFRLPYHNSSDGSRAGRSFNNENLEQLEREVQSYPGFKWTTRMTTIFGGRGLPTAYLLLLQKLLNRIPKTRPSSEQVLRALREGTLDPVEATIGGEGTIVARHASPDDFYDAVDDTTAQLELHDSGNDEPPDYSDHDGRSPGPRKARLEEPIPLLALEPPTPPAVAVDDLARRMTLLRPALVVWTDFWRWTTLSRQAIIRGIKSLLLILKVCLIIQYS